MNEETIILVCMKSRCALMRKVLKEQIGFTVVRFSEMDEATFGRFTVTVESPEMAYRLGQIMGRSEVFSKLQSE